MIITILKIKIHNQKVILNQVTIKEINHNIHPVLAVVIIILPKIMLSMLKITH